MTLKLYNTLTKKKEDFHPIKDNQVGIYTCGPTVYNYAHIGNFRAYVFSDTLRRVLKMDGFNVKQIINITDVGHLASDGDDGEDKLEKGAKREGKSVWEVAEFYTQQFFKDLQLLNIEPATIYPKATDHIKEMIDLIKKLEDKGYTYNSGGNVYFDTSKFSDYGKMAGLDLSPEAAKSRVEQDSNKKSPFDFVLWFTKYKYASHEMQWDSPWGKGFPGWHIECSAMANKYLGERVDIHTGGIDHVPVHHTNEIAQSEAAFGHKWVNYWLHNEFLTVKNGEKMAKSSGEFLRLQSLIEKGYSALDYRYYLLGGNYRSVMQFSFEALDHAKNSLSRIRSKIKALNYKGNTELSKDAQEFKNAFIKSLNDDLNTAKALAVLWETLDSEQLTDDEKVELITYFDTVLGLSLRKAEEGKVPSSVIESAQKRQDLRNEGKWEEADSIRQEVEKSGYKILDTKEGFKIEKL